MHLATGHWAQWINYQVSGVFETAFHNRKMNLIKFINILGLFDNFLLFVVDNFFPLTKQGKRSKKKHLSKEAIRKIKYKRLMLKTYRHTGSKKTMPFIKKHLIKLQLK